MRLSRCLSVVVLVCFLLPAVAQPPATPSPVRKASRAAPSEADYYRIVTLPVPPGVVLEVGGLAMRPDGKLLCCTRRGDVWLISKPDAEKPADVTYKLFATGLHEPLGM